MTLPEITLYLGYAATVAWLVPILWLAPAVCRVLRACTTLRYHDILWAWIWFVALVVDGFALIRSIFPSTTMIMSSQELLARAPLYLLSVGAALLLPLVVRSYERS